MLLCQGAHDRRMNWKYKASLQLILSFLPFGEKINHQLQKLYGGKDHFLIDGALQDGLKMIKALQDHGLEGVRGKTIVEVGTGWQPTIPVLCSCLGAGTVYTYDHVAHVRIDLVKDLLQQMARKIGTVPELRGMDRAAMVQKGAEAGGDLAGLLRALHIEYRAPADAARTGLPPDTVDIFFSNKVLEHVPEQEIIPVCREAWRVLKPGGFFYNSVGMLDHYSYFDKKVSRVNCLRYPDLFWRIMAQNKISYQNRLRRSAYLDMISTCGFEIVASDTIIFDGDLDIVKRMPLAGRFKGMDPADLAASFVEIVARKI